MLNSIVNISYKWIKIWSQFLYKCTQYLSLCRSTFQCWTSRLINQNLFEINRSSSILHHVSFVSSKHLYSSVRLFTVYHQLISIKYWFNNFFNFIICMLYIIVNHELHILLEWILLQINPFNNQLFKQFKVKLEIRITLKLVHILHLILILYITILKKVLL